MNGKAEILVVEDSETQALKLCYLFEDQGWETCCATSAEAALEMLNGRHPDLIIADYHLPGIRGDQFCRQIRMNVSTREIPVLMLTMEDTRFMESSGLDSGADDYVSKSASPDILILRIRALLRKSSARSARMGPHGSHFRSTRLLAIDDSPTYLQFLAEELGGEGYEIEMSNSGEKGLERIASEEFDCALVDLVMPGMDGIEVCRRIVGMDRRLNRSIVVIMLTSRETKDDMTMGLEAGADDFVGKSSDSAVLKARIRALLRRKLFQEENRRILEELKNKELEALSARAAQEAAEVRALLADELARAHEELGRAHKELKDAQSHMVQREKMASLGQLVAGIAHEINNPLAFVINSAYLVEERLNTVVAEIEPHLSTASTANLTKIRARLRDMNGGLTRVKEIVTKLRTFSRLDEGEFKTVSIRESLETVITFLQHRLDDRIEIERNYADNDLIGCYGGQLNQVFMNLVSNAVDAIDGPGKITIETRRDSDMFRISVRDTGHGIPAAIQSRIFEPFFTTKPVGHGTGLGLAISYRIIQSHHGTLEVHSEPMAGTEFTIQIPLDLERRLKP